MKVKVSKDYLNSRGWICDVVHPELCPCPDFIELEAEPVEGEKCCGDYKREGHWCSGNINANSRVADHPKLPEIVSGKWTSTEVAIAIELSNNIIRYLKARE